MISILFAESLDNNFAYLTARNDYDIISPLFPFIQHLNAPPCRGATQLYPNSNRDLCPIALCPAGPFQSYLSKPFFGLPEGLSFIKPEGRHIRRQAEWTYRCRALDRGI